MEQSPVPGLDPGKALGKLSGKANRQHPEKPEVTLQKPKLKDYRQKEEQVEEWTQERLPAIEKSWARAKAS